MKTSIQLCLVVGLLASGLRAQECACGALCDVTLEESIEGLEIVTACNTVVALGAQVTGSGVAQVRAGESIAFWSGFAVLESGELSLSLDLQLSCDRSVDSDADGVDECLDCDDADPNNWASCGSCTDGDGDGAWAGCDAYTTIGGPDCADGDSARHPGSAETCNTIDDDCNGLVDECLACSPPAASSPFGCLTCGPASLDGGGHA